MVTNKNTADTLNKLLRGELAATETYQQALENVEVAPAAAELQWMHEEHREAANTLRQHVHHFGGQPVTGSGAWGAFAKAIEGTATLFGTKAALKGLKEVEEHGMQGYRDALETELPSAARMLIVSKLLPQAESHVVALEQLVMSR